jgi:hypothetical protein
MQLWPSKESAKQSPFTSSQDTGEGVLVRGTGVGVGGMGVGISGTGVLVGNTIVAVGPEVGVCGAAVAQADKRMSSRHAMINCPHHTLIFIFASF